MKTAIRRFRGIVRFWFGWRSVPALGLLVGLALVGEGSLRTAAGTLAGMCVLLLLGWQGSSEADRMRSLHATLRDRERSARRLDRQANRLKARVAALESADALRLADAPPELAGSAGATLVMTVRNAGSTITAALRRVADQLGALDLILVDRGSTDDTLARVFATIPSHARVYEAPRASIKEALLAGIRAAQSERVVLIEGNVPDAPSATGRLWQSAQQRHLGSQLLSLGSSSTAMVADREVLLAADWQSLPSGPGTLAALHADIECPGMNPSGLGEINATSLRRPVRQPLSPKQLDHPMAGGVALYPAADYHNGEIVPLAAAVQGVDKPVGIVAADRWWPAIEPGLLRSKVAVYDDPGVGAWLRTLGALVVMNDWAVDERALVLQAQAYGTPTFAKVEGVQDFADDDIQRERFAYQTVDHVLCQGENDVSALSDANVTCHVVGSSRLEAIWNGPARPVGPELAVLNLNFTWGVLTDARDLWLETAIEGCKSAGIPFIISPHPSERSLPPGLPVAEDPMRHLLTRATVLVSRFSTVPFEAMARGVPFVYHNPHEEAVPTFKSPDGAFDISTDASELAQALRDARQWADCYRDRVRDFFLAQVNVTERSSAERTADVLLRTIERR